MYWELVFENVQISQCDFGVGNLCCVIYFYATITVSLLCLSLGGVKGFYVRCIPGPPRISRPVEEKHVVRLGHTVRLPCPVEGDPPPLVLWVKDGRNVNQGWGRYRVLRRSLKISEIEASDAGMYVCRATNGFGSLALNYTVVIVGECTPLSSKVRYVALQVPPATIRKSAKRIRAQPPG